LVVGFTAFGFVGDVNAQIDTPLYPGNGGNGRGPAAGAGTGMPVAQNINLDGLLDDAMAAIIADGLGISVEDLQARLAAGETLVEIGVSLGFDVETVIALHDQARVDVLTQAVADGLITQEQADWLISRLDNGQYGAGTAAGTGICIGDCSQTGLQYGRRARQNGRMNCLTAAP